MTNWAIKLVNLWYHCDQSGTHIDHLESFQFIEYNAVVRFVEKLKCIL